MPEPARNFTPLLRLFLIHTILLGFAALNGCSSSNPSMGSQPIAVSITNKVTAIAAGSAAATLNSSVQNDSTNSPVFYLAAPAATTESIQAFGVGSDASASFGLLEPGAPTNVTTSSLAGNYFFSDEQARAETVVSRVGTVKISATGVATGTEDDSATAGLSTKAVNYAVTIDNADGPGTGNVGANTFAISNGTKLFFFQEAGPASITVVEHQ